GRGQQARYEVVGWDVGSRDERPVRQRHAEPRGLRAADELAVLARRLIARFAVRARVVGSEEGADDELTWLDRGYGASDLLDNPAVLVTHRCRLGHLLHASVGPEVRTADARGREVDDGVCRVEDLRVGTLFEADIAGLVEDGGSHGSSLRRGVRVNYAPRR